jgi:hypothetical protein
MADWFKRLGNIGNKVWKKGKDALISSTFTGFILNKTKLQRYGKLQQLQLDSFAKEITFTLLPAGETVPIEVRATYETLAENQIQFTALAVSRKWLHLLARQYVLARTFKVPGELYSLLT